MCGIIGIASKLPVARRDWLTAGCDALSHRGPDDAGDWWSDDGRVGLAHRRLSIIDLSVAGHQPMRDATGALSIAFNGEIYNFTELREKLAAKGHAFRSHSDTEVILAAYREWGVDCLSHLNGMFAFGLFDSREQAVFLARDRAGEKPLFFHHANGTLRFASELKSLMADATLPRRINLEALDCYLAMGYVPGELCILQDFSKLPAAHALRFNMSTGESETWRYWHLPELKSNVVMGKVDEVSLLDDLETLIQNAVRCQLVADVPVGVLLSGGVDSSLVTAMAVRASSQVQTFTIGFPGHGTLDETEHALLIARHFGTQHTDLIAEPATADLLPRLARQFDEPMVDSSMIPTFLVSQLVKQHCSVALGGDGGDELFGGYKHYSRLLWMQKHSVGIPRFLQRGLALFAEHCLPPGFKTRNYLQGLGMDLRHGLPLLARYFDPATRQKLMSGHPGHALVAEALREARIPHQADLLQRATRMDFYDYLAEDILVKVDRASMLNSLEVRAPFLDYRVIEFAFGRVPSHLKATSAERKVLLKRLAARVLPPEFNRQRKQGLSIPIADWLKRGPFRELFWDTLLSSNAFFDRRTARGFLEKQDLGFNNGERLFALVLFDLWRREYAVSI